LSVAHRHQQALRDVDLANIDQQQRETLRRHTTTPPNPATGPYAEGAPH
jgi:hypothetical protein